MMKKLLFLLFLTFSLKSFSQDTGGVKVQIKDFHSAQITDLLRDPDEEFLFSADESGKILMQRINDYSFHKTLAPSDGIPIKKMRLIRNDSVLLVSKGFKYNFGNPGSDSIVAYNIFNKSIAFKKAYPASFLGEDRESISIAAKQNNGIYYFEVLDRNNLNNRVYSLWSDHEIIHSAYNFKSGKIALVKKDHLNSYLQVLNTEDREVLLEEEFLYDQGFIVHLLYDGSGSDLYAFAYNKEAEELEVFKYAVDTFAKTRVGNFPFSAISSPSVETFKEQGNLKIIISSDENLVGVPPLVLSLADGIVKRESVKVDFPVTAGTYIGANDQLVFFRSFVGNMQDVVNFSTYDSRSGLLLDSYPEKIESNYTAAFLPGGNWMVTGIEYGLKSDPSSFFADQGVNVKYFGSGTFDNRFGKIRMEDYLKLYHGIEKSPSNDFIIDKTSGVLAFLGSSVEESYNDRKFFTYDLINDKAEQFTSEEVDFLIPVDYNEEKKRLLVSNGQYYDGGYEDPRAFKILEPDKFTEIKGDHKHGLLSRNGEKLLLVTAKNEIQVLDINRNKILLSHPVEDADFKLYAVDEDSFMVSLAYDIFDPSSCNQETISVFIEDNEYQTKVQDCIFFSDFDYQNDVVAIIFEGIGIGVRNRKLEFPLAEFPKSLSLNPDGSRLLVNFEKGKSEIYDTESLELLGGMIHPDRNTHIFYDTEGNYFGNNYLKDYLYATKGDIPVPLEEVQGKYDPKKILSLFGTPNAKYAEALDKAQAIRDQRAARIGNFNNRPVIRNLLLDGERNKVFSSKSTVEVELEVADKWGSIKEWRMELNNVQLKDISIKEAEGKKYSFDLPLVDSLNVLRITAINENGISSFPLEKTIKYQGDPQKPDLYLLAVGVSDYSQSDWDLTFADKDAFDIVKLYGALSEADLAAYRSNFQGRTYKLLKEGDDQAKELNVFRDYNYPYNLYPVSASGKYWLENEGEDFYLWNFEAGEVKNILLPADFRIPSFSTEKLIYIDPDGRGFYVKSRADKLYKYDFNTRSFTEVDVPFSLKETPIFPLSDNKWFSYTTERVPSSYSDSISISISGPAGDNRETTKFHVNLEGYNLPEVKAVSKTGESWLIKTSDDLWFMEKSGTEIKKEKLILDVEPEYDAQFQLADNGDYFSLLQSGESGRDFYTFERNGNLLEVINIGEEEDPLEAINDAGANLKWIEAGPSMTAYKGISASMEEEVFMKATPASFEKVHVRYLTNQEATYENIQAELSSFSAGATHEDQIIVFLAGHGVLDDEFNYYFAPHDMDFDQVENKGVPYADIMDSMQNSASTKKLLLMDTCHAGNIFDLSEGDTSVAVAGNAGERGSVVVQSRATDFKVSDVISTMFDNFTSTNGITILSASSGSDVAYEAEELNNGAFTTAFISALKNNLKGTYNYSIGEEELQRSVLLTERLIYEIQKDVISLTNKKQVPDIREINELAKIRIW